MNRENKRPLILITNDDGYSANGIQQLAQIVAPMGDVVMVAPDSARSGASSALTAHLPIRLKLLEVREGYRAYSCSGTPVDCVKLALHSVLDRKPDLIVSGINHGSNAGVSVIYSGTMGAAIEGAIVGVPAIGFSYTSHQSDVCLEGCCNVVAQICQEVLEGGLPKGVCLNVNIPEGELKGRKLCRQTSGEWVDQYEKRTDPAGNDYFWLTGHFRNHEPECEETDEWALAQGYVSVVPVNCDMTDYDYLRTFAQE